jgi:hypothetical protein
MAMPPLTAHDTRFQGIAIAVRGPADGFMAVVEDALETIGSRPIGRMLLSSIAHDGPPHPRKVVIRDAASNMRTNRAVRHNEMAGCWRQPSIVPGSGTFTRIDWDPNIQWTPDGARPPFVGLAHELIHARRNLLGIGYLNDNRTEELHTVGLSLGSPGKATPNDHKGWGAITENDIRAEHGLPLRTRYSFPTGDLVEEFEYMAQYF